MLWPMPVLLSSTLHVRLVAEARDAQPNECCGLLFGEADRIERARPARNVAADPRTGFEIDPAILIAAERAHRQGVERLIGHYHSHPVGAALPSACDAASAASDGRIWIIIAGDEMTAWRAVAGGRWRSAFEPLDLQLIG
jgi:proteasome lid subunit RPN8/RPN11